MGLNYLYPLSGVSTVNNLHILVSRHVHLIAVTYLIDCLGCGADVRHFTGSVSKDW